MFTFSLIHHPRNLHISRAIVRGIFRSLDETIPRTQKGVVNIICVSEQEIMRWNHQYRQKNVPTDILTFVYYENFELCSSGETVGEILICPSYILQQKNPPQQQFHPDVDYYPILIHGLVHLMGYDHETETQYQEMKHKEHQVHKAISQTKEKNLRP